MDKFGPKEAPYGSLTYKQQLQWDFIHWKDFERIMDKGDEDPSLNVMYFPHGTTPVLNDFSEIIINYINHKIRI